MNTRSKSRKKADSTKVQRAPPEATSTVTTNKKVTKKKTKRKQARDYQGAGAKNKVCLLCHEKDPPSLIDEGEITDAQRQNIPWIECDSCSQWIHGQCTGIEPEEFRNLPKKGTWFKCVICSVVSLEKFHRQTKFGIQPLIQQAVEVRFESLERSRECSNVNPSTEEDSGPVIGESPTILDESVRTERHSQEEDRNERECAQESQRDIEDNSLHQQTSTSFSADRTLKKKQGQRGQVRTNERKLVEEPGPSVVDLETKESTRSKILVIDNIKDPKRFCNSKDILSEFNKFFPDTEVDFAYLLPKGGISLHVKSKEERDHLIKEFPAEAFGGGVNPHPPKEPKSPYIYIKGVDTSIDKEEVRSALRAERVELSSIVRLKNSFTGKPTRTLKVLCNNGSWKTLIDKVKLTFKGILCQIEKEKEVRVIQCFNCQRFGHLSKNCGKNQCCPHCGNEHPRYHCTLPAKCINCNGGHPAFSKSCPEYTKRVQHLTDQHSE